MPSWGRGLPRLGLVLERQLVGAQQPQDPLAADMDAVLATHPGPDIAVAFAGDLRIITDTDGAIHGTYCQVDRPAFCPLQ